MILLNNENLKFKNIHGDFDEYLLNKLNDGEDISKDYNYDAKRVSGGFINSRLCYLHDSNYKKTIVNALHIPDKKSNKIHHFDLHFVRFKKGRKKDDKWEISPIKDLRDNEVKNLCEFISEQKKLIGLKSDRLYYRILSSNHPVSLDDLNFALDLVLKNQQFDFSSIDNTKLFSLVERVLSGDNVVLEKSLYQKLVTTRFSDKSIKGYEKDLKDFKELIENKKTTETDMQEFLGQKNRIWFFGLNYFQSHRRSKPKFNTTIDSEYDFLLEGFNQVYDIAELKGPNELMFEVEKTGVRQNAMDNRVDYKFSSKFSRALHQVMSYMDEFEQSFNLIKEKQPSIKDLLYPKGTIIISKRALFSQKGKNSIKYLHLINRQFANIDILTYDDLADRAQIIIDFIKSVKK